MIEIVIVLALITALMAISLPMLSVANAEARAVACKQNLADTGEAITGYILDHDKLPTIIELPPHREGVSLPEIVAPRLHTPHVLFCPSDETDQSQLLGTSYQWASVYNGLGMSELWRAVDRPLLTDRESYHVGTEMPVNELVLQRNTRGSYNLAVLGVSDPQAPGDPPSTTSGGDDSDDDDGHRHRDNGNGHKHGHNKHKHDKHRHRQPQRNSRGQHPGDFGRHRH